MGLHVHRNHEGLLGTGKLGGRELQRSAKDFISMYSLQSSEIGVALSMGVLDAKDLKVCSLKKSYTK